MDAGCYPVNMVRAVAHAAGAGEPKVTGAKATMTAGGVDRALKGTMQFDDGPTASIACSLLSAHAVDIRLRVVGSRGKLGILNPVMPHLFGRMRWTVDGQRHSAKAVRTPSYAFQLRAFAAAVNDGAPFPTTAADGVANMAVIDDLLRAAGEQPYQPTVRSDT
jgi:predicted dehydrogenase